MRAVLIPVAGYPEVIEIEDDLKAIQCAVGGSFDVMGWVFNDAPSLYVNDSGKFECQPNRAIYATAEDAGKTLWSGGKVNEGDVLDIVFGDILALGFDPETGEARGVTDEEIDRIAERFGTPESVESGYSEAMRIAQRGR